jgi:hypothetical protein
LYTSAVATQRHLHELVNRLRAADVCGYFTVVTPVSEGVLLFLHGMPHYATALRQETPISRYDRDAYELIYQTVDATPSHSLTLQRLEERQTRAITALFQPPTFTRKLANSTDLRFVLEVVGGCHFHGCLQFRSKSEHAVVLVHEGRPLGVYDVHGQQIQKGLAAPMTAVLGQPSPQVDFYPQPIKDPVPLTPASASKTSSPNTLAKSQAAAPAAQATASSSTTNSLAEERVATSSHVEPRSRPIVQEAQASSSTQIEEQGARKVQHIRRGDPVRDEFAETQLLWLLTSLDRRWAQVKEKLLQQPSTLTILAAMLTQAMAKVEATRTGNPDAVADPKALGDVSAELRARFGPAAGFSVTGNKADVASLLAHMRGLDGPKATHDWLLSGVAALVAGIRIGIQQLIDQVGTEVIHERMRETANVFLADMDAEVAKHQPAVARGRA